MTNTPTNELFREKARNYVLNKYGETFLKKASEQFCLSLFANLTANRQSAAFLEDAMATVQARQENFPAAIIELRPERFAATDYSIKDLKAWSQLQKAVKSINASPIDLVLSTQQMARQQQVRQYRDAILQKSNDLLTFLGKSISNNFALQARSLRDAPEAIDLCWLNQTIQSLASPEILADLAADERISTLDLPRQLVAELDVTGPAVSAPQFRTKFARTGKGIIVAVIDSEVLAAHSGFGGRVIQKKNYTMEPWGTPHFHGTAVAGIIAADDPQFPGIAPGATIYHYKVLAANSYLNTTDFQGSKAIEDALEDGAHIANCSWGTGLAGNGTSREARAFDTAWAAGMSIVKSAGNAGLNGPGTLTSPADAAGVIVVGATDKSGKQVCDYSSQGPIQGRPFRPHMVAPGAASNERISTATASGSMGQISFGTSFAAPHVTGLLALILESQDLSPEEQRNFLIKLCVQLPGAGVDEQGHGFISFADLLKNGII